MVQLKDISLYFYGKDGHVLKNIDWHIKDSEKWILLGRNGAGKTKLLEIITGYTSPSSGEVVRFEKEALGSDIRDLRKRIGYISTSLKEKFGPGETVLDVAVSGIYASIGLYVEPGPEEYKKAEALLDTVGLLDRAGERFTILSDGEKQKVLTARALINDPDLLIFDEASKGLDLAAREDLLESIERTCSARAVSVIYVTHHIEEITPYFDKLFILNNSRCRYQGPVKEGLTPEILGDIFEREIAVKKLDDRYYAIVRG
jgi:iron complex transport system ATP-binding protein